MDPSSVELAVKKNRSDVRADTSLLSGLSPLESIHVLGRDQHPKRDGATTSASIVTAHQLLHSRPGGKAAVRKVRKLEFPKGPDKVVGHKGYLGFQRYVQILVERDLSGCRGIWYVDARLVSS